MNAKRNGPSWIAAGLLFALSLCVSSSSRAESPDDMALTWDYGKVVLPSSIAWVRTRDIRDLPPDLARPRSIPAIVYIHGSDGIQPSSIELARALADAGFAVFLPDSFKRPGRVSNCDPKTLKCGAWLEVYRHRDEEIAYAAQAMRRIPFVDPNRVVLVGHSEGGIAVAQYSGDFFKGIVISGWFCGPVTKGGDRYFNTYPGIKSPLRVSILSIYSQNDPWFSDRGGLDGDCSRYLEGRTQSQALLYSGNVHYLLDRRDIRRAMIDFARSVTGASK